MLPWLLSMCFLGFGGISVNKHKGVVAAQPVGFQTLKPLDHIDACIPFKASMVCLLTLKSAGRLFISHLALFPIQVGTPNRWAHEAPIWTTAHSC